jgi:tetratricopeptide (TPR) repeat protein
MVQTGLNAHLEWIRSAEKAIKEGNYESAARLFLHASTYYGIVNDEPNRKKFAIKSGESLLSAGEVCLAQKGVIKAIMFFIKAIGSFRDGGDNELAERNKSKINECYAKLKVDSSLKVNNNIRDLKTIGDYFVGGNDLEDAVEIFQLTADRAREEGKHVLAAGLFRDVGDCHRALKNFGAAAKSYGKAADMFLLCDNFFEAARHYCESCFYFILTRELQEASVMAAKADFACDVGQIDVILNDLSEVCRLLSQKSLDDAEECWNKIRKKFKKSYVDMVDSCFKALSAS